ncbi:hypothetical protein [Natrinema amylolyticum]|uniref:hypothetical protein n=1 Tax=Natrinema amylolyticum TaxID=2878679 RepID=UPI001CF95DDC|nr:hypothetical protein [Natrinema amylolyticum]
MSNDIIEFELLGNATVIQTDGEPPVVVPQTVTLPAPTGDDKVAVLQLPREVSLIDVLPRDNDDLEYYDRDMATQAIVDGESKSEAWLSADALANADQLMIETRNGQDLESVSVDGEYRGWTAQFRKRIREFKQSRRTNKAPVRGR